MESGKAERIAQLQRTRRERLPQVRAEIARWRQNDQHLVELASAVEELRRRPSVPADDAIDHTVPRLAEIRANITDIIESFSAGQARFSRETVNIGVSGSVRVGMSTLLQSISHSPRVRAGCRPEIRMALRLAAGEGV